MYLMYVDESGDPGLINSPSRYYILTGIVLHELRWQPYLEQLIDFRRRMKTAFGLKLNEEIHAAAFINSPGSLARIKRNDRLSILRFFADELAGMTDLNIINIIVDKHTKQVGYDVFGMAWRALIQRFENTASRHNFSGPANADDRGMIFPDHTDDKKLIGLIRQMRRFNPVPNQGGHGAGYRNLTLNWVIEDPNMRNSQTSYFIQSADVAAYLLYQLNSPNSYMKKKSAQNYFYRLLPVLCKVASTSNPYGIVRL